MDRNYWLPCILGILSWFVASTIGRLTIVGGMKAKDRQFPYQVALLQRGQDVCGGGIIDDKFVLTAAHCVIEADGQFLKDNLFVIAGTRILKPPGMEAMLVEVHKIFVPQHYQSDYVLSSGDIAVLKLAKALNLSRNIQPVRLPKHKNEDFHGKTAEIAGFGWDHINLTHDGLETGSNTDAKLRYAQTTILKQCPVLDLSEHQLCAKVKHHIFSDSRGTCMGDSGSPLVHDGVAVGILSVSPQGCNEKDVGAIYTRISHYLDFIHEAMMDKPNNHLRIHEYSEL